MCIRDRLLESTGLSISTDLIHNRTVQNIGTTGTAAVTQALMQLPDRIPQPGQLERTEFITAAGAGPPVDPVAQAASWLRAVGRSSTRCRKPSRRTSFTVWVTRELPTS